MKIELKKETFSGVSRGIQGYPGVSRGCSVDTFLFCGSGIGQVQVSPSLAFPHVFKVFGLADFTKRQGFRLLGGDSLAGILALDSLAT